MQGQDPTEDMTLPRPLADFGNAPVQSCASLPRPLRAGALLLSGFLYHPRIELGASRYRPMDTALRLTLLLLAASALPAQGVATVLLLPSNGLGAQTADLQTTRELPDTTLQFDPETGLPIAKVTIKDTTLRFDPETGEPIKRAPVLLFDPKTGEMIGPATRTAPALEVDETDAPGAAGVSYLGGLPAGIILLDGTRFEATLTSIDDRTLQVSEILGEHTSTSTGTVKRRLEKIRHVPLVAVGGITITGEKRGLVGGLLGGLFGSALGCGVPLLHGLATENYALLSLAFVSAPIGGLIGAISGANSRVKETHDLAYLAPEEKRAEIERLASLTLKE